MKQFTMTLIMVMTLVRATYAAPPISFDSSRKNVFGGYDYYKNGHMVYKSTSNVFKSENIYSKKGLDFRGYKTTIGTERWNKSRNYAR